MNELKAIQCDFCGHWGDSNREDNDENICTSCNYGHYEKFAFVNEKDMNDFTAIKHNELKKNLASVATNIMKLPMESIIDICIGLKECQMVFGGRDFANLLITIQDNVQDTCLSCTKHFTNDPRTKCHKAITGVCVDFEAIL